MERLTYQEEEAMRNLWSIGDGTVKDILAFYDEPKPPYTTLASVVKNLERKGYVKARRVGNTYLYTPLQEEKEYKRLSLARVVNDYFGSSYKELVSFFVEEKALTPGELREMLEMIENGTTEATDKS